MTNTAVGRSTAIRSTAIPKNGHAVDMLIRSGGKRIRKNSSSTRMMMSALDNVDCHVACFCLFVCFVLSRSILFSRSCMFVSSLFPRVIMIAGVL